MFDRQYEIFTLLKTQDLRSFNAQKIIIATSQKIEFKLFDIWFQALILIVAVTMIIILN